MRLRQETLRRAHWCGTVDRVPSLSSTPSSPAAEWTIEQHLAGQPEASIDLYHRFISAVEAIGPFMYAVSKSSITLKGERRGFAGAKPVRQGLRGYFDLARVLDDDPRILSAAAFSKTLYVHHFRLASADELDDEFLSWLAEAYAVGAGAHLRPPGR